MAGSISLSLSQQFNNLGAPLSGGKLHFYEAGTVATPQNAFQDTGLTIEHPNPITLDSAGRVPQFYLADGSIKIKLTNSAGVVQVEADNVLVVGASSGGGGGGGVDPSTVFQTGDVMWLDVNTTRSGWVRDNGRTIGSASSGATERANADTEDLFVWLWENFSDTLCPVSTGRGASGAADFAANKTITLHDKRGWILGGVDDMGNTAAGEWSGIAVVTGSITTAGAKIGAARVTLTSAGMPPHSHTYSGTTGSEGASHTHNANDASNKSIGVSGGADSLVWGGSTSTATGTQSGSHTHTYSGTTAETGSGSSHDNVQKTVLGTFFRKL